MNTTLPPLQSRKTDPRITPIQERMYVIDAPSTDAERAAFVKEMARAGVAIGIYDMRNEAALKKARQLENEPRPGDRLPERHLPTPRALTGDDRDDARVMRPTSDADSRSAKRRITDGKTKPTTGDSTATEGTGSPWYRIELRVSGEIVLLNVATRQTPREIVARAFKHGLMTTLDGDLYCTDPASTSSVRVGIMMTPPHGPLATLDDTWRMP